MRAPASAFPVVRCSGAPRDLGFDQGVALAPRIAREALLETPRAQPARWWMEHAPTRRARALRHAWRDTLRHFPHMAERTLGLARGSGVGTFALAGLLARASETARAPDAVRVLESARGVLLARALTAPRDALLLRHSAPTPGYASAEVALAWQTSALLGVNAQGLALSGAPVFFAKTRMKQTHTRANELRSAQDAARGFGSADVRDTAHATRLHAAQYVAHATHPHGARDAAHTTRPHDAQTATHAIHPRDARVAERACAAPAVLLAQDCLQRFDTVAKALDWMARRPTAGGAEFWLADAQGARAAVRVECDAGGARRVRSLMATDDAAQALESQDAHASQDAPRAAVARELQSELDVAAAHTLQSAPPAAARALRDASDDAALAVALRAVFAPATDIIAVAELATRRVGVLLPDARWAWCAA